MRYSSELVRKAIHVSSLALPIALHFTPVGISKRVLVALTLLTLLVALPAAAVLSRGRFHGRSLLRALLVVPFVLPTIVVATAFAMRQRDRFSRGNGLGRMTFHRRLLEAPCGAGGCDGISKQAF